MLFLIGVDHSVQHNGRAGYSGNKFNELRLGFSEHLRQLVLKHKANVLAEELNEEVLDKFNASDSTARALAKELNIEHIFCEPSITRREELGIKNIGNPDNYELRENEWLTKLTEFTDKTIVFVIGAEHIDTFSSRAIEEGYSVKILDLYYGKEYFSP
ncbi:MAG: hypothetical protein O7D86_10865 [Proteobacteria bacterium]|nr:hypothetical protein [Pseudomonadota bacterium]